eukprot:EG_transcript_20248
MAGLVAFLDYNKLRKEISHPKLSAQGKCRNMSYADIHKLVAKTSQSINKFQPDVIVGIGGGGYIPARILRTFIPSAPVLAVTIQFYDDVNLEVRPEPKILQWIDDSTAAEFITGKRVLIVDDIDDTRTTLGTVVPKMCEFNPAKIAIFVLHSKKKEKHAHADVEEWFVGEMIDDIWVEYPWDAIDIDKHQGR